MMTKVTSSSTERTETTQKRRKLILETAAECFITKGFHQTSIRDIANAAKISVGNVYNHFDSKESLIAEIAELEAEELGHFEYMLANQGDPIKTVEKFVDSYLQYMEKQANTILAIEITAEAIRNPAVGQGFVKNRKRLSVAISKVISEGIENGCFDPKADGREAPEHLIDLIEGLALRSIFTGKKSSKRSRKSLHAMIRKSIAVS